MAKREDMDGVSSGSKTVAGRSHWWYEFQRLSLHRLVLPTIGTRETPTHEQISGGNFVSVILPIIEYRLS